MSRIFSVRQWFIAGCFVIVIVAVIIYQSALKMGLYADDYEFLERAGRTAWLPYLVFYTTELAYFRPIQYILLKIAFAFFGANPFGYHLVQLSLHLANALLLFAIAHRVARRWQIGFVAALFFASAPVIHLDIFWISVADPLSTFFYLVTIWLWVRYLETGARKIFVALFALYAIALATKEMNASLPFTLFLLQYFILRARTRVALKLPFILLWGFWLVYFTFAFWYQKDRVPAGNPAPLSGFVGHALGEIFPYLANVVAPWDIPSPANYFWLALCLGLFIYFVRTREHRWLYFLGIEILIVVLPLLPFLCGCGRYLYLPLLFSALLFALGVYAIQRALPRTRALAAGFIAIVLLAHGLGVNESAAQFSGLISNMREPLRAVVRAHPVLPSNTLIYFIEPPLPQLFLSGEFFLHYGAGVYVQSDEKPVMPNFDQYANAIIIFADEQGAWREQTRARAAWRAVPDLPLDFAEPIRLEGVEIGASRVKRGDTLPLLLYWRARGKIEKDYTVFVHLLDARGEIIAGEDHAPRAGTELTSQWSLNRLTIDAFLLPIPRDAAPGAYRIEIGLYFAPTLQRVLILDAQGAVWTDRVEIESLFVQE